MQKHREVEDAKALMTEAMSWSVIRWLREKKRVRKAADQANAFLDRLNQNVKDSWSEDVKIAFQDLLGKAEPVNHTHPRRAENYMNSRNSEAALFAKKVKDADDEAYRARMEAEKTFDEAERLLSTRLAREGCRQAIRSWELHEKAILIAQK